MWYQSLLCQTSPIVTFDASVAVVHKRTRLGYHSVDWYWQINKWLSPNTDEDTIQPMLLCKILKHYYAFTSFKVLKLKLRFKPLPDVLTFQKLSEQKQCYQFSSHCIQSSNSSDFWRWRDELWHCYQKTLLSYSSIVHQYLGAATPKPLNSQRKQGLVN
jgi:hypothetical protein